MSGIFGVVASGADCREDLFYGTDYHSHLGTQFAGMAVFGAQLRRKIHGISSSQFKSKFFEDFKEFSGDKGIGVISSNEEQPLCVNSRFGPLAIVTNGFIENTAELAEELYQQGQSFSEVSDGKVNPTELAAKLILRGKDIVSGIEYLFGKISGSCSLLILSKDGIYAARDSRGHFPLIAGHNNGSWAVTTETAAFHNLGYSAVKYLSSGEIVLLTKNGIKCESSGSPVSQTCSFLWIYTGFPASSYEGINTEIVRENSGKLMAAGDGIEADLAAGIPDSGTAHAIGYSMGSGLPYRRVLIKYTPGYGRSYTPPSQEIRDHVAKMKLIAVPEIIRGKRVVICDDSIVRGTQLKNFTVSKLKECGVKEVHLRIACPPLMFPCKFNFSTRSINELAARRAIRSLEGKDVDDVSGYIDERSDSHAKMVDWIRRDVGATTLKFQKLDDMVAAIGLPKEKLCLYCWTGKGFCKGESCELKSSKTIRKNTAVSSV